MKIALKRGDICHIRLIDSQIINDVYYLEDVDNAGKRMHKFGNGLQEYMVNPSYVSQITKHVARKKVDSGKI